ncbi:MAG: transglutaminase domain-containing protein [Clostridiaceae bacterium]|nr:transglutaminase domain-containing protein [Clostridiaceae bacterium]
MGFLFIVFSLNAIADINLLDTSNSGNGVVGIEYPGDGSGRYKVVIAKGAEKYYYDYMGLKKEYFPLQCGNGEYEISILENLYGTTYRLIKTERLNVNVAEENIVYLQPIQNVYWENNMSAIVKAAELTEGLELASDKVKAVYNYIVENIDYDFEKLKTLDKLYVPDIDAVYNSGKGICYDYASLFASMLRSQGIPAKLVKGYSDNIDGYHAWNEVFIDGEWVIIDTTYAAVLRDKPEFNGFEKNNSAYKAARVY